MHPTWTHLKCYTRDLTFFDEQRRMTERYLALAGDETVRRAEDTPMAKTTLTAAETLHARMQGVRLKYPEWPAERAMTYCLNADPELKRQYASDPTGAGGVPDVVISPSVGGAPARPAWAVAGDEVVRRAKRIMAEKNVSMEQAIALVLAQDTELKIRYEGRR